MQRSLIVSVLQVRNDFIKTRVTVKSSDLMSALFSGQTSNEYNNIGMRLLFTRCKKTSSDAILPSLLNSAFIDRKDERFALFKEHLNLQDCTITVPKYLILSTNAIRPIGSNVSITVILVAKTVFDHGKFTGSIPNKCDTDGLDITTWPLEMLISVTVTDKIEHPTANLEFSATASSNKVHPGDCDNDLLQNVEI